MAGTRNDYLLVQDSECAIHLSRVSTRYVTAISSIRGAYPRIGPTYS